MSEEGLPGPEKLGNAPSLRDAPGGFEWRVALENFANRAKSRGIDGPTEWLQEALSQIAIAVDAEVRESERTEKPSPYGSLVISRIAFAGSTRAVASVV